MTAHRSGWTAVATTALLALAIPVLPAAPAQLNLARLLDRYAAGEFEAVARAVVERAVDDPDKLLVELQVGGLRWVNTADTPEGLRARRLVAAAVALEAAGAPGYVTTTAGVPGYASGKAAQPVPDFGTRIEALIGGSSFGRRGLVAWGLTVLLDLRSPDRPIQAATAQGQPPTKLDEAERQWFLSVVALVSSSGDLTFPIVPAVPDAPPRGYARPALPRPRVSLLHIARLRFPDEPRFRLAEVYLDERRTRVLGQGTVVSIQTQTPEDGVIPPRLLNQRPDPQAVPFSRPGYSMSTVEYALSLLEGIGAGYEALTAEADVRGEAFVRLGYHCLRVGDRAAAITAFTEALASTQDDFLRYLALFFRGWARHRSSDRAEAERDYNAALQINSAGRPVRALLASVMADRGDRQAAREVLGESLSRLLPERDPWFMFHQGDFRFHPARIVAMREALR
jgi:hypothetical protein